MNFDETPRPLLPRWLYALCLLLVFSGIGARMTVIGLSRYLNQSAENSAVAGILDVSEGKILYPDKSTTPFRLYTYTPLQALVVGKILVPLKNSATMTRVYLIRLSSFVFLILSFFLFWRVYLKGTDIKGSFFILAISLGFSEFGNYALSGRNDALALLLEITAGAFFIIWISSPQKRMLLLYVCFCTLALLARQNSACMIASGTIYLLWNHKYRDLALVIVTFAFLTLFSFLITSHYFPHFWMHSFKTHLGVWRTFYWLHPNSLQFFACHSLFIFLGMKNIFKKESTPKVNFLKIVTAVSFMLSFTLIHRHGGWLNYFFETLLVLTFFTSREISQIAALPETSRARHFISISIPMAALLISVVTFTKAKNNLSSLAFLEFTEAAKKVQEMAPQGGVSLGAWAQGLGVHLRNWEIIGPEILNGSHYGEANYSTFKWVYDKLSSQINSSTPPVLLYVNPNCGGPKEAAPLISDPHLMTLMGNYRLKSVIYSWLCVYSKQAS